MQLNTSINQGDHPCFPGGGVKGAVAAQIGGAGHVFFLGGIKEGDEGSGLDACELQNTARYSPTVKATLPVERRINGLSGVGGGIAFGGLGLFPFAVENKFSFALFRLRVGAEIFDRKLDICPRRVDILFCFAIGELERSLVDDE